jgi:hypothetical protein
MRLVTCARHRAHEASVQHRIKGASVLANSPISPTMGMVMNKAPATTPVRTPLLVGHSARARPTMAKAVAGYSAIVSSFTPITLEPNNHVLKPTMPAISGGLEK